jgi:hypothetical protein
MCTDAAQRVDKMPSNVGRIVDQSLSKALYDPDETSGM